MLARGEFPPATTTDALQWRWAHCRMKRRTNKVAMDTFLLDLSGDALLEELERPNTCPVINGMIRRATGLMLIVDADRIHQGDKDEEFFALKILGHVQNVWERSRQDETAAKGRRWTRKSVKSTQPGIPPLSIIQMKADRCAECFDDPAEYARCQLPNVWQYCHERFPNHQFFAASAIGASAQMPDARGRLDTIPLRVEPRGIMAPFRWQFAQFTP